MPTAPAVPLCPAGHGVLQLRQGRTGPFYGCGKYPACRETAPVGLPGILCPTCGAPVVERIAKKTGKPFWPCGNRACRFVSWRKPHVCAHGEACWGEEAIVSPTTITGAGAVPDDDVPF